MSLYTCHVCALCIVTFDPCWGVPFILFAKTAVPKCLIRGHYEGAPIVSTVPFRGWLLSTVFLVFTQTGWFVFHQPI